MRNSMPRPERTRTSKRLSFFFLASSFSWLPGGLQQNPPLPCTIFFGGSPERNSGESSSKCTVRPWIQGRRKLPSPFKKTLYRSIFAMQILGATSPHPLPCFATGRCRSTAADGKISRCCRGLVHDYPRQSARDSKAKGRSQVLRISWTSRALDRIICNACSPW